MRNWVKASQGMILLILLRYYSGHHKRIKRSTSNILRRFVGGGGGVKIVCTIIQHPTFNILMCLKQFKQCSNRRQFNFNFRSYYHSYSEQTLVGKHYGFSIRFADYVVILFWFHYLAVIVHKNENGFGQGH